VNVVNTGTCKSVFAESFIDAHIMITREDCTRDNNATIDISAWVGRNF